MGFFDDLGGAIFGNGSDPGLLGTSRYKVNVRDVDPNVGIVPGAEGLAGRVNTGLDALGNRQAPTMSAAVIDPAQQAQVRGQQMALTGDLQAAARGEGPSVAQLQLNQATDRNLAGGVSMANTVRGAGAAAALRQLGAQRGQIGQQAAADSALLRANEIAMNRQLLGQQLAQVRGADIGLATSQAQLGQDAGARNLDARLRTTEGTDAQQRALLGMGLNIGQAQQQAVAQQANMGIQRDMGVAGLEMQAFEDAARRRKALMDQVISGAANAATMGATGGALPAGAGVEGFASAPVPM